MQCCEPHMRLPTPALKGKPNTFHAGAEIHLLALCCHHVGVLALLIQIRVQLRACLNRLQLEVTDNCAPAAWLVVVDASCRP